MRFAALVASWRLASSYWERMAARLEWQVDCYLRFLEKEAGPVSPRGHLKRCMDTYLRTEMMLGRVYDRIEGRQVEDDRESLAALFRGGAG
jgi:hypothetical protein